MILKDIRHIILSMNTQTLINEAISLPVEQRTQVVESLLASLNQPHSDIDKAWLAVAKKRLTQMQEGTVETFSEKEVFKEIFDTFQK